MSEQLAGVIREHTGPALIVQHCAVMHRLETPVRWFRVGQPRPYAQHPASVCVGFKKPRKRVPHYYTITPDNIRYLTIEVGGRVVYDSRQEVPCDMAKWEETRSRFPLPACRVLPTGV
jgi:hypothetical protein